MPIGYLSHRLARSGSAGGTTNMQSASASTAQQQQPVASPRASKLLANEFIAAEAAVTSSNLLCAPPASHEPGVIPTPPVSSGLPPLPSSLDPSAGHHMAHCGYASTTPAHSSCGGGSSCGGSSTSGGGSVFAAPSTRLHSITSAASGSGSEAAAAGMARGVWSGVGLVCGTGSDDCGSSSGLVDGDGGRFAGNQSSGGSGSGSLGGSAESDAGGRATGCSGGVTSASVNTSLGGASTALCSSRATTDGGASACGSAGQHPSVGGAAAEEAWHGHAALHAVAEEAEEAPCATSGLRLSHADSDPHEPPPPSGACSPPQLPGSPRGGRSGGLPASILLGAAGLSGVPLPPASFLAAPESAGESPPAAGTHLWRRRGLEPQSDGGVLIGSVGLDAVEAAAAAPGLPPPGHGRVGAIIARLGGSSRSMGGCSGSRRSLMAVVDEAAEGPRAPLAATRSRIPRPLPPTAAAIATALIDGQAGAGPHQKKVVVPPLRLGALTAAAGLPVTANNGNFTVDAASPAESALSPLTPSGLLPAASDYSPKGPGSARRSRIPTAPSVDASSFAASPLGAGGSTAAASLRSSVPSAIARKASAAPMAAVSTTSRPQTRAVGAACASSYARGGSGGGPVSSSTSTIRKSLLVATAPSKAEAAGGLHTYQMPTRSSVLRASVSSLASIASHGTSASAAAAPRPPFNPSGRAPAAKPALGSASVRSSLAASTDMPLLRSEVATGKQAGGASGRATAKGGASSALPPWRWSTAATSIKQIPSLNSPREGQPGPSVRASFAAAPSSLGANPSPRTATATGSRIPTASPRPATVRSPRPTGLAATKSARAAAGPGAAAGGALQVRMRQQQQPMRPVRRYSQGGESACSDAAATARTLLAPGTGGGNYGAAASPAPSVPPLLTGASPPFGTPSRPGAGGWSPGSSPFANGGGSACSSSGRGRPQLRSPRCMSPVPQLPLSPGGRLVHGAPMSPGDEMPMASPDPLACVTSRKRLLAGAGGHADDGAEGKARRGLALAFDGEAGEVDGTLLLCGGAWARREAGAAKAWRGLAPCPSRRQTEVARGEEDGESSAAQALALAGLPEEAQPCVWGLGEALPGRSRRATKAARADGRHTSSGGGAWGSAGEESDGSSGSDVSFGLPAWAWKSVAALLDEPAGADAGAQAGADETGAWPQRQWLVASLAAATPPRRHGVDYPALRQHHHQHHQQQQHQHQQLLHTESGSGQGAGQRHVVPPSRPLPWSALEHDDPSLMPLRRLPSTPRRRRQQSAVAAAVPSRGTPCRLRPAASAAACAASDAAAAAVATPVVWSSSGEEEPAVPLPRAASPLGARARASAAAVDAACGEDGPQGHPLAPLSGRRLDAMVRESLRVRLSTVATPRRNGAACDHAFDDDDAVMHSAGIEQEHQQDDGGDVAFLNAYGAAAVAAVAAGGPLGDASMRRLRALEEAGTMLAGSASGVFGELGLGLALREGDGRALEPRPTLDSVGGAPPEPVAAAAATVAVMEFVEQRHPLVGTVYESEAEEEACDADMLSYGGRLPEGGQQKQKLMLPLPPLVSAPASPMPVASLGVASTAPGGSPSATATAAAGLAGPLQPSGALPLPTSLSVTAAGNAAATTPTTTSRSCGGASGPVAASLPVAAHQHQQQRYDAEDEAQVLLASVECLPQQQQQHRRPTPADVSTPSGAATLRTRHRRVDSRYSDGDGLCLASPSFGAAPATSAGAASPQPLAGSETGACTAASALPAWPAEALESEEPRGRSLSRAGSGGSSSSAQRHPSLERLRGSVAQALESLRVSGNGMSGGLTGSGGSGSLVKQGLQSAGSSGALATAAYVPEEAMLLLPSPPAEAVAAAAEPEAPPQVTLLQAGESLQVAGVASAAASGELVTSGSVAADATTTPRGMSRFYGLSTVMSVLGAAAAGAAGALGGASVAAGGGAAAAGTAAAATASAGGAAAAAAGATTAAAAGATAAAGAVAVTVGPVVAVAGLAAAAVAAAGAAFIPRSYYSRWSLSPRGSVGIATAAAPAATTAAAGALHDNAAPVFGSDVHADDGIQGAVPAADAFAGALGAAAAAAAAGDGFAGDLCGGLEAEVSAWTLIEQKQQAAAPPSLTDSAAASRCSSRAVSGGSAAPPTTPCAAYAAVAGAALHAAALLLLTAADEAATAGAAVAVAAVVAEQGAMEALAEARQRLLGVTLAAEVAKVAADAVDGEAAASEAVVELVARRKRWMQLAAEQAGADAAGSLASAAAVNDAVVAYVAAAEQAKQRQQQRRRQQLVLASLAAASEVAGAQAADAVRAAAAEPAALLRLAHSRQVVVQMSLAVEAAGAAEAVRAQRAESAALQAAAEMRATSIGAGTAAAAAIRGGVAQAEAWQRLALLRRVTLSAALAVEAAAAAAQLRAEVAELAALRALVARRDHALATAAGAIAGDAALAVRSADGAATAVGLMAASRQALLQAVSEATGSQAGASVQASSALVDQAAAFVARRRALLQRISAVAAADAAIAAHASAASAVDMSALVARRSAMLATLSHATAEGAAAAVSAAAAEHDACVVMAAELAQQRELERAAVEAAAAAAARLAADLEEAGRASGAAAFTSVLATAAEAAAQEEEAARCDLRSRHRQLMSVAARRAGADAADAVRATAAEERGLRRLAAKALAAQQQMSVCATVLGTTVALLAAAAPARAAASASLSASASWAASTADAEAAPAAVVPPSRRRRVAAAAVRVAEPSVGEEEAMAARRAAMEVPRSFPLRSFCGLMSSGSLGGQAFVESFPLTLRPFCGSDGGHSSGCGSDVGDLEADVSGDVGAGAGAGAAVTNGLGEQLGRPGSADAGSAKLVSSHPVALNDSSDAESEDEAVEGRVNGAAAKAPGAQCGGRQAAPGLRSFPLPLKEL
ncbi:hypothetical protein CHLRE_13g581300v5 [Chlamydomonas reinhardtii]|uniref:Uncharacterized protein n=1 Tax=Chlamydomonas reinhardtii TaxID=3055 RepID=A0A2K3D0D4_CHLRE|nr:uncharacterized protein CHLRE_13g581300v5 [Chlamydomonas reinhardtii]PNW74002.1 hypothetical protein CHLRE_13g581300v5 [Chlamydomonas reinhardtii]